MNGFCTMRLPNWSWACTMIVPVSSAVMSSKAVPVAVDVGA